MNAATLTAEDVAAALAAHLAAQAPWGTTLQHLALWSPGLLVLIGLFVLLRRPPAFVAQFIQAQQAQAAAMEGLARSVEHAGSQGSAMQTEVLRRLDSVDLDVRMIIDRLSDNDRRAHEALAGILEQLQAGERRAAHGSH